MRDALWMHMRFYSRDGGLAFYSRGGGLWDRCSGQCTCYSRALLLLLLLLLLPLLPLPSLPSLLPRRLLSLG